MATRTKVIVGQKPRIQAIVLDCDGVILESNDIKADTLRRLFGDYPEHGEAIINLHREHGGMPRHEKLRVICEDIIGQPVDEDEIRRLSEECGRLVDDAMMACPFAPGGLEFLKTYSAVCPLFIATGTPEEEMRALAERRDFAAYFAGIYGAPRDKAAILRDVMAENGWSPGEIVFIGDSMEDYNGARAVGTPFVGRISPGKDGGFDSVELGLCVSSLAELDDIWGGVPVSPS